MRVRLRGNCCPERIKYQRIVIGIPDDITYDPSVIQIQDSTEIDFFHFNTCIVFEFCNIGQPFLVGLVGFKFPVQQIICQIIGIFVLPGAAMVTVLNCGLNPAAPADPEHPLVIHMGIVAPIQLILESAVSHLRMLLMDVFNKIRNTLILSGPG